MKLKYSYFLPVLAAICVLVPIHVSAQSADYAAEVLTKGAGARPLAMGGAFVAAANDATAAYWNPAGLALVDDVEITTMHTIQSDIQSYDFVNLALNTHSAGSYALSYMRLGTDGIPQTDANYGTTGLINSYLSYQDQAALISGGWKIGKQFAVGGTIKLLKSDISGGFGSAFGIGSDLGVLFKPIKELTIGLVARDYTGGSYVMWSGTASSPTQVLQPSATLGISWTEEIGKRESVNNTPIPVSTFSVNFDADTLYVGKSLNNYHLGVEYWYKQLFAVRGGLLTKGFQFDADSFTPSFGVGIWAYLFEIDYAFVSNPIGALHNISLITRL